MAPPPIIYTTGRLQDKQVVSLINQIDEHFGASNKSFSFGTVSIPVSEIEKVIGKGNSYAISDGNITTAKSEFQIYFRRGTSGTNTNHQINTSVRMPSPYFDEIIIITSQTHAQIISPTPEQCLKLDRIVGDFISLHVPKAVDAGAKGAIDLLQKEIADLAAFHKSMLSDANEQRAKLEADYLKKHADLEEKSTTKQYEIEALAKAENEKLANLTTELEKKQKTLDDRNHMHVRRQLREQISEDIKVRVSKTLLPPRTLFMNWVIVIFTIICALVAGAVAYGSYTSFAELLTYKVGDNAPPIENINWLTISMAIRGLVASAVTLGFLVYALSWMRKTYLDNVQISNDLQRYALDINRASWTIETIMEMTTKEGRVLPDKWIEGVCHGLFRSPEYEKTEITPLDAWGSLLSMAGKVEYGPDGPKLEFNKGQAKKLAQGYEPK